MYYNFALHYHECNFTLYILIGLASRSCEIWTIDFFKQKHRIQSIGICVARADKWEVLDEYSTI